MTTIPVPLLPSERNALKVLARNERRDVRAQAAMLIRNELTRRGLLVTTDQRADAPTVLPSSSARTKEVAT